MPGKLPFVPTFETLFNHRLPQVMQDSWNEYPDQTAVRGASHDHRLIKRDDAVRWAQAYEANPPLST